MNLLNRLLILMCLLCISCNGELSEEVSSPNDSSKELPLSISTTSIAQGKVGENFEVALTSQGGVQPYTFSTQDSLPPGVTLSSQGVLSGTPDSVFSATITFVATDSENATVARAFLITISPPDGIERCAVIVDFDSAGSTLPDSRFDTIFSDVYTDVYQDGITTVIGSHENYNHAGVSGAGFSLYSGDKIRLIWKNVSSVNSHTFSPRISFIETGRFTTSNSANWLLSSSLTLNPGETGVSEYTIPSYTTSNTFNVNQNINQGKQLLLDRIEFVESARGTNEVCVID